MGVKGDPCVTISWEPNEWGGVSLVFKPLNEEGEQVIRAISSNFDYYGESPDLWGQTWTPADINDPDFGVAIRPSS